ncbi:MAG: cupin domain-containing protein [Actinobacteria bacterium]|nr:cupin domain-containing protein [Actinomycetota bacterium]
MSDKSKDSSGIPSWMGNHPFPPDKKRPVLINKKDEVITVYGSGKEKISPHIAISTDKILISTWHVPPGQTFQPPDIHSGDEPYYVLKGTATVVNPETGQVVEANEGDAVLIPAKCWHQVYNFTEEDLIIVAIIEGKIWEIEDIDSVSGFKFKQVVLKERP